MEMRQLGQSSLHVYPITFGGNVFGWTADEAMSFKLLDGFVAAGFNFIDSADAYSRWHPGNKGGESETIIGNWLKARGGREKVVIATKLGIEMAPGKKKAYRVKYLGAGGRRLTLRRLPPDYIDLYQSHHATTRTAPIEETLSAYADLIKQGKVREIVRVRTLSARRLAGGVENQHREDPAALSKPATALQPRGAGGIRGAAGRFVPEGRRSGSLAYYSLASGFLTGRNVRSQADASRDAFARGSRVEKCLDDYGFGVLAALDDVAKRYDALPVQIAMAWLIARPSVTAPIASATNPDAVELRSC